MTHITSKLHYWRILQGNSLLVYLVSIYHPSYNSSFIFSGHILVLTSSVISGMLFIYFLFIFIDLLIYLCLQNICFISIICSVLYDTSSVLLGYVFVSTLSEVSSILLTYFLFIFIYLLTFFFSQNIYLTPTICPVLYHTLSMLPGHVSIPVSSVISGILFVYFFYFYLFTNLFFSQNIRFIPTMHPISYYGLFALPGHVSVSILSGVSSISLIYFIFIFIYLLTLFFCRVFVSFPLYVLLYTIPC